MFKTQAERWLRDLDLVKREEFEAVKDMARLAREENEALKARIAALEAKLPGTPPSPPTYAAGPDGTPPVGLKFGDFPPFLVFSGASGL